MGRHRPEQDHTLENLLDLDGDIYVIDETAGYWVKFVVRRVIPSPKRPHGIEYSLTMHDSSNRRLVGFDNAHPALGQNGTRAARAVLTITGIDWARSSLTHTRMPQSWLQISGKRSMKCSS